MDKTFEHLSTVLDRVEKEKDKNKPEDKKGINKDELRNVFKTFCSTIDVDIRNLLDEKNHYCFTAKESQYLEYFFLHMSEPPIRDLRKGNFDRVPYYIYEKLEEFLEGCMRNVGKDTDCIENQMMAFRHRTGWIYRRDSNIALEEAISRLTDIFVLIQSKACLNINNRLDILSAIRYSLQKHLDLFYRQWNDAIYEMSEKLDEILINDAIESLNPTLAKYWRAVEEAESRIGGSQGNTAYTIRGETEDDDCPQGERLRVMQEQLWELQEQLARLKPGKIGNQEEAASYRRKIEACEEEIWKACYEKYGLSTKTVEQIKAEVGQGHGHDDLVRRIIGETVKKLLNTDSVPDWQQGPETEEETEPVTEEFDLMLKKWNKEADEFIFSIDKEALKNL